MSWIQITEDHFVASAMSGDELEGIRNAALADGQDDPLEASLGLVTNEIRGSVAACERNTLGAEGTIPDELLGIALDLLVVRVLNRVGGSVSDAREASRKAALKRLDAVADCKYHIQDPADADADPDDQPKVGRPIISAGTRRMTRETQDGA